MATTVLLGLAGAPAPARACGPAPLEVAVLAPPLGASDVPLNAALVAASNQGPVSFDLRELPADTPVPVTVSCAAHLDGSVCLGHPALLRPDTEYRWSVPGSQEPAPRTFRTRRTTDFDPPAVGNAKISVASREPQSPGPCGTTLSRNTFRVELPDLQERAVLAPAPLRGPTGLNVELAPVGPQARVAMVTLATEDRCVTFRVIDEAGNTTYLDPFCPGAGPATTADGGSTKGASQSGGCAVAGRRPARLPPVLAAGLALLALALSSRAERRRAGR
jgi:hypothetical protein